MARTASAVTTRTPTIPASASKSLSERPALPVRQAWEYAESSVANEDLRGWLALMGAEGWELVNFHQYTTQAFAPVWRVVVKRPA